MTWAMTEKGVRNPSREKPRADAAEPNGLPVLPGTYKLRLTFGGQKDSAMINVKLDPRFANLGSANETRYLMSKEVEKLTSLATAAMDRLRESKEIADEFENKMKDLKRDDLKDAKDKTKAIKDSIAAVMDYIVGKEDKRQGIVRHPDPTPISYLGNAEMYIRSSKDPITSTDQRVFKQAEDEVQKIIDRTNNFFAKPWPEYKAVMEKVSISPFKNYDALRRN
jgi:hypothetical protein